ncbi:hypothetical protein [Paracoccus tegillarcae]|uniref:Sulfotransferase family protein n=1 Tax=Paracoccus tegillarcae TaxID=1529068 RepID=A0A2K9EH92_9RHOB|nr:hypothetical protein [Paracoccus tegillarcae]AUH33689.1 hypothetical protein CUV01_10085 [Paracoccus tegillarcae]
MGLFVHLGVHKTATTHLSDCILAAEEELLASEVVFLDAERLRHPPLSLRGLLSDPAAKPRARKLVRDILRGLAAEHRNLILSEEQIVGRLGGGRFLGAAGQVYPGAGQRLSRLLDLLGTRDVTLLLALRSPADFLTSTFGEVLRHDGPLRIEDFLGDFDPVSLRWSELVARLMDQSGAARMVCWRYEDLASVREDMLTILLGADLARAVPDLPPTRVGLSDAGYRALLQQSSGQQAERQKTGAMLRAHPKRTASDRLRVLPQAVHDACERLYIEDCARIAAMPGVRLLTAKGQG